MSLVFFLSPFFGVGSALQRENKNHVHIVCPAYTHTHKYTRELHTDTGAAVATAARDCTLPGRAPCVSLNEQGEALPQAHAPPLLPGVRVSLFLTGRGPGEMRVPVLRRLCVVGRVHGVWCLTRRGLEAARLQQCSAASSGKKMTEQPRASS